MIPVIIIGLITFVLISVSSLVLPTIKIGKFKIETFWLFALLGALVLLISTLVPLDELWNSLTSSNEVNPIKILVLFFSMTVISIYLDECGLFAYLANLTAKKANNKQWVLFLALYLLVSILTVFTSNDIVILTMTPFICQFCKNSKVNPIPYLVAEFTAANTWSMILIIGNPTNIYLATASSIDFIEYFKVMALPTIFSGLIELALLFIIFMPSLKKPLTPDLREVKITQKSDLIIGLVHLIICLIFLIITPYTGIQMWLIAMFSAISLLLCGLIIRLVTKRNWHFLRQSLVRLPYQLIPFVLAMFVIVVAFNYQGVSQKIGELLGNSSTTFVYGYASFLSANIINNIPMSILFSDITNSLSNTLFLKGVYASIIGSNIGAFLTPLGALAGVMFSSLLKKYQVKFTFLDFIKYGAIISIPVLSIALLTLELVI